MNKLKRALGILLALSVIICLFCGCGKKQENTPDDTDVPYEEDMPEDTIVLNDGVFSLCYDDKKGINPITGAAPDNMLFNSLMFDYVYKLTKDNMPYSEIVTEYTTNDFSWWVFHIVEDVYFSDGSLLTAKDVVYSIVQGMMSDVHGENLIDINGISAMGSNCFAVSLREPNAMLPNLLTVPIVKREQGEEDAYHLGSGAYMLSEDGTRLVINPYSRYKDSLPAEYIELVTYDEITEKISAFESGKVDLVLNDPSSMYNLGYGSSNEVRYADTMNMHFVGFNTDSNYFMTPEARHAFNYIIDRDTIVSKCLDSNGVKTCYPCHP
ncbi:MAG: ABC transporter substrate-binding protein, partial [Oscillospiraceae bacterium]|nr:ABC transporter substrate-binding protein [Oscillospiraceae bacterium]